MAQEAMVIELKVNGVSRRVLVEARRLLADALREDLGLTGTNLGCQQGTCGTCTVLVNGETVRSCLMLAAQADGQEVTTVEGLGHNGELHPLQAAFWDRQALQCGFCTPGFLLTGIELLERNPHPTDDEIREGLAGNICRCTGYEHIVDAVRQAAEDGGAERVAPGPSDVDITAEIIETEGSAR